jgi:hypothetical protein
MARRDGRAVEGDRFTLSEAAELLGICRQSLFEWLKRHKLLRRCPHVGRYRYVNVEVLERYREATEPAGVERHAVRPRGWVGIDRAGDLAGCHPSLIYRAVRRGEVRAARVGQIHYYCPEDLQALRLRLNEAPLPGWIEIALYAEARGVSRVAVVAWLRRHGFEIRLYRRRRDRRKVACALRSALEAWEAAAGRAGRGTGGRSDGNEGGCHA